MLKNQKILKLYIFLACRLLSFPASALLTLPLRFFLNLAPGVIRYSVEIKSDVIIFMLMEE